MQNNSEGYRVFVSYSRRDEKLKERLLDHLSSGVARHILEGP